eukprot:m.345088 g.345088  ORF g.345088 m.345088 type:complete len:184 (+) comp25733_c0_seq1:127-678(+)
MDGCTNITCILTYNGSLDDICINYSVLGATVLIALFFYVAKFTARGAQENKLALQGWVQLLLLILVMAFQVGLCFGVGCSGVSIVWNALGSWLVFTERRMIYGISSLWSPYPPHIKGAAQALLTIVVAMVLAVDVYYGIISELLTTIAHVCAIILGLVLGFVYERCCCWPRANDGWSYALLSE